MSIYPNVTEQDLINLRELAKPQEEQNNIILKQTHDLKLAESLLPNTKKLGDVIKESKPETSQSAIDNTSQPAIENTQISLPIENERIQPGVVYDRSLENTLSNMKNFLGFFNIEETDNGDIFWNGVPVEKKEGNKAKINEKIYKITPGTQRVLADTSNIPLKNLIDKDNEKFINILENLGFEIYKAIRGESKSGRYKQSETFFKKP